MKICTACRTNLPNWEHIYAWIDPTDPTIKPLCKECYDEITRVKCDLCLRDITRELQYFSFQSGQTICDKCFE